MPGFAACSRSSSSARRMASSKNISVRQFVYLKSTKFSGKYNSCRPYQLLCNRSPLAKRHSHFSRGEAAIGDLFDKINSIVFSGYFQLAICENTTNLRNSQQIA